MRQNTHDIVGLGVILTIDVMRHVLPKIEDVLDDRLRVITSNGGSTP